MISSTPPNGKPKPTDAADQAHQEALRAGAECLEAALDYQRRGWPALAVCPPNHASVGKTHARNCNSPGKAPWGEWKEFQTRPPTEAELRRKWRDNPQLNVGMATGEIIGLDVDEVGGEELLARLSKGDLPPTPEFTSGKGRRLLYRKPAGVTLRNTPKPGGFEVEKGELRLLGLGAQTVMPPSRHVSGRRYSWVQGKSPNDLPFAPAPEWVVGLMSEGGARPDATPGNGHGHGEEIHQGNRDSELFRLACAVRRQGLTEDEIYAALEVVNRERCVPPLPGGTVRAKAASACKYAPDPDIANGHIVMGTSKGAAGNTAAAQRSPVYRRMSDVKPQPIRWFWRGWIPRGALTLLDGDPGFFKSTIAIGLAARATRGWAMPPAEIGDVVGEPEQVLILSAEDDVAGTVRPRLDAAGADATRVYHLDAIRAGEEEQPPVLPFDLLVVEAMIREHGITLVVIDPFMAFLDGKIDSHRDQDVRRCLHRLKIIAERTGCAVLVIRHLNKLHGGPALYRGGGSIGIVGAARSALIVGRDPQDQDRYVLASTKCNLSARPKSLAYRAQSAGDVACIYWEGECDLTADDILEHAGGTKKQTVPEQCAEPHCTGAH
jgi:hypothetical protein